MFEELRFKVLKFIYSIKYRICCMIYGKQKYVDMLWKQLDEKFESITD